MIENEATFNNPIVSVSEIMEQQDEEETMKLKEINLTNQLIGEVQHFIFVMRWVIYQFYNFR